MEVRRVFFAFEEDLRARRFLVCLTLRFPLPPHVGMEISLFNWGGNNPLEFGTFIIYLTDTFSIPNIYIFVNYTHNIDYLKKYFFEIFRLDFLLRTFLDLFVLRFPPFIEENERD